MLSGQAVIKRRPPRDTVPAAFRAMVRAVNEDNVTAVAVPSMHHFAVIGEPAAIKHELERTTSARVLIASFAP